MLFSDEYKTIDGISEGVFRDKGSKFIAKAYPVSSEKDVKFHLEQLKKQYYDATHHCYAYMLGYDKSAFRSNDDGEPSGTAGKPILGQILSNDLTNILIVVIRYYGGVKLGVPGLINAYKMASADSIHNAKVVTRIVKEVYEMEFPYERMNDVMKIIKDELLEVINNDFGMKCVIEVAIRYTKSDQVMARFNKLNNLTIKHMRIF